MPVTVKTTYECDQCKTTDIEWNYKTVTTHTIKKPSFEHAIYYEPQPEPIYCSLECLGKALQWWAEKYDKNLERKND